MSNSSYPSVSSTKSFQSSLHQSPSLSQARYPGASTSSNYSNSQPFMSTLSLSSAQNASPVIPAFGHSIVMSSSMLSPELSDVNQTSPFVNNSSSVITDGLSLAPSVSDMDFKITFFYGSVSTPVPVLSVTRSLLSPINISKSYNQSSLVIEQTVTRQASSGFNGTTISSNETSPLPQSISFTNLGLRTTTLSSHVQQPRNTIVVSTQTNSSFNETTISSNHTSFGASVDFTSSFNLLSAAPTSPLPQSISSTIWTFRTTMFSSNVQQTGISQAVTRQTSYGINATTISSNESSLTTSTDVNLTLSLDVISVTPAMTVSRSISFSILTFRVTALSSLVQSMGDSSYASGAVYDGKSSVISATLFQNVSINDSRSYSETDSRLAASPLTAVSSSLSSYLLTETSSFAGLPGVESLSSLGTVTSSQGPPRTSCCVMQLSTAVMSHSSLLVHSMVSVSVTMHTPRYSVSSPVNYFTSTDAQPPSTKSKLSSKFSTASGSFVLLTNGESTLAANGSATFTTVSSLANTSISSGSDHLSKKYSLSTIFNPVQSTSITLHQASSSMHIQSSNFRRY